MARRTYPSTSKPNSCAESIRACARPRPMSPYAYDYGAGGAALFDIVNVQIWTRRRARRTQKVASTPGAASRSFCQFFTSWLSSSGRALAS